MPLAYLTAEVARDRLIASGRYTVETAPTLAALTDVLTTIEVRVDDWLGARLAPTDYTETYVSSASSQILLRQYPVISIVSITALPDVLFDGDTASTPLTPLSMSSIWRQKRTVYVPSANTPFAIHYRAGYDPVPAIAAIAVFDILNHALAHGGSLSDLSFLDQPTRDVASISLPGGLSKTFRVGGAAGSSMNQGSGRELDRILAPLKRYRRRILC